MRKKLVLLLALALCLLSAACGSQPAPTLPGEYPMEFEFSSGAGAWRTTLLLNADGTFTGQYSDSDMGDAGDAYPNGTLYLCSFSGRFEVQTSDDSVTLLHLTELVCQTEPGTQEIKGGTLHVYTGPHGFYDYEAVLCPDFFLYPPSTPVAAASENLLSWWPGRFEPVQPDTLGVYALENPAAGTAFFSLPRIFS